ncbi:LRP2-binding protein isoform X2 [Megalobrama amblycephala]|uniref:LRP2-binding protein isoform X2 n=1 Tax=Megalobrama amblycephala TaxID=75352 RepID=UPI0020144250|nr:LRP2-binding protein isoform X2 [Megalobrama amblycephala]
MDCSGLEKITTSKFLNTITEIFEDIREELTQSESSAESVEKTVTLLKEKSERGDSQAAFLLGQLHYEEGRYAEAEIIFDGIKDEDPRALYQLAVIYYDGLGNKEDLVRTFLLFISLRSTGKAIEYMRRVAFWDSSEVGSVRHAALYNLGRAYLEGYGVQASSAEAERLWLLAADDGNPNASVEAQSSLGMFYCRPESLDLRKAFSWHSEACGNGSLESQGALGVMYLYGHGVQKDPDAALFCLKDAAERGNVYAQGHLTACYYHRKLYSRAAALGERVCTYEDISAIARHTGCLEEFIRKGIAIAMFYYARCLHLGRGVLQNRDRAKSYFAQAARIDPEICQELQMDVVHGRI